MRNFLCHHGDIVQYYNDANILVIGCIVKIAWSDYLEKFIFEIKNSNGGIDSIVRESIKARVGVGCLVT